MSFMNDEDWLAGGGGPSAGPSRSSSSAPGLPPQDFLSRLSSVAPTESVDGDIFGDGEDDGDQARGVELDEEVFSAAALSPGLDEDELDDVRRLARIWVRERGTPTILAWEGDLLDSLLAKIEQQNNMIRVLRSDDRTSEEEHFRMVLVKTEIERAKFLVRSYVRTRLHKIEKFAQYISETEGMHHLLSGAELQHARRYTELLHTHFSHSVLDSLPDWLQRMDDKGNDGVSMVTQPNLNNPVLIYCRKDCGEITLEKGEVAILGKGTTHLVRYHLVERWIQLGFAEVL